LQTVLVGRWGFSKPYAILQRGRERYYARRGTRIQEASRDELLRLFQTSGQIHYETTPTIKGGYANLDFTRIVDFFRHNQINSENIWGHILIINYSISADDEG